MSISLEIRPYSPLCLSGHRWMAMLDCRCCPCPCLSPSWGNYHFTMLLWWCGHTWWPKICTSVPSVQCWCARLVYKTCLQCRDVSDQWAVPGSRVRCSGSSSCPCSTWVRTQLSSHHFSSSEIKLSKNLNCNYWNFPPADLLVCSLYQDISIACRSLGVSK